MIAIVAVCGFAASAQTADEIVARYVKAVGGLDKIQAVHSLRRSGKFIGGGGFEAVILQENKRDASVREEFSLQGMTAINAYDGKTGWKVEPWNGKKDAELLHADQDRHETHRTRRRARVRNCFGRLQTGKRVVLALCA